MGNKHSAKQVSTTPAPMSHPAPPPLRRLEDCTLPDLSYEIFMMGNSESVPLPPLVAERYSSLISAPCTQEEQKRFAAIFSRGAMIVFSSSNQDEWLQFLSCRGMTNADHNSVILRCLHSLQLSGVRVRQQSAPATVSTLAHAPPSQSHLPWPLDKISSTVNERPRIVLLSTGALNPVHLGHVSAMERARKYLNSMGYNVICGYMSPTHDDYVGPKMQSQVSQPRVAAIKCFSRGVAALIM
jgi:hypothetical protein